MIKIYWGNGGNMAKKEVKSYLENLEKKKEISKNFCMGTALFTGISVTGALVAGMMGGSAYLTEKLTADDIKDMIVSTDGFEGSIADKKAEIQNDFINGQLSEEDYHSQIDSLYSMSHAIQYAKVSGDDTLEGIVANYEKTQDMKTTVIKEGIPTMCAFAGAGLVGLSISEVIRRRYERKIAEYKASQEKLSTPEM